MTSRPALHSGGGGRGGGGRLFPGVGVVCRSNESSAWEDWCCTAPPERYLQSNHQSQTSKSYLQITQQSWTAYSYVLAPVTRYHQTTFGHGIPTVTGFMQSKTSYSRIISMQLRTIYMQSRDSSSIAYPRSSAPPGQWLLATDRQCCPPTYVLLIVSS